MVWECEILSVLLQKIREFQKIYINISFSNLLQNCGYPFQKFRRIIGTVLEKVMQKHRNYKKFFIISGIMAWFFIRFAEL